MASRPVTTANPEQSGDAKPTGLNESAGLPQRENPMDTQVKRTLKLGICVGLSLGAIVGLVGCGEQSDDIGGTHEAAITGLNGFTGFNGLAGLNGLSGQNGLTGQNGFTGQNGLSA